ncbi:hypothetical protein ABFS82_02G176400 [Erythranthe guttata]|uniref:Uncharacterized protein n=1 Tax=Erythranthe guttata TaxID=4155 RepID=A0A022QY17_ERYGU|nr:PREDICTED: uncharacterized protein At4g00950-like [Erythranthe guttata]EYU32263.1 hypothetical protein MIMGU_mgv1a019998mg [Erythranthe guttata]|eukprot:XP_012843876.1 PREDICTED: uncharacterized protein At4g00950-like [Erythranthe guttata]
MGEENEKEPRTLKLPISAAATLLSFMDSPEHASGTATPPLASVPFKWEELPGKPRPCSHNLARPEPKSLELPPMMLMSRTPSPTSVLDGRPKCSSFRFFMDGHDSFLLHSATSTPGDGGDDDTTLEYGLMFGSSSNNNNKKKSSSRRYGLFGNKDKGGKKEFNGGISGFSPFSTTTTSSCESDEMRRNGSFSSVPLPKSSSSPLTWATICSGFKQVIQWKSSKKSNKQGQH